MILKKFSSVICIIAVTVVSAGMVPDVKPVGVESVTLVGVESVTPVESVDKEDSIISKEIDNVAEKLMKILQIPGLSLAIVKNDTVFKTIGYGYKNLEDKQKVSDSTFFSIASISKTYTATLAVKCFKDRNISMDEPLINILGKGKLVFPDRYRTEQMTMKDLLSHRTGLEPNNLNLFSEGVPDRDEFVYRLRYSKVLDKFRYRYIYNNEMYLLAGWILEQITGHTFEDLLLTEIFNPLGTDDMTVGSFGDEMNETDYTVTYYLNETNQYVPVDTQIIKRMRPYTPAGGILSNARNMAKYLMFQLKYGQGFIDLDTEEERFNKESMAALYSPVITLDEIKVNIGSDFLDLVYAVGLAFEKGIIQGKDVFCHAGSWVNQISLLRLYPDLNVGVFTVTNGPTSVQQSIMNRYLHNAIFMLLTDGKYPENLFNLTESLMKEALEGEKQQFELKMIKIEKLKCDIEESLPFSNLSGTYGSPLHGNLTINISGDGSQLIATTGWVNGPLKATNYIGIFEIYLEYSPLYFNVKPMKMYVVFNTFQESTKNVLYADIILENDYFLRFERDLKLSDEPEKLWTDNDC